MITRVLTITNCCINYIGGVLIHYEYMYFKHETVFIGFQKKYLLAGNKITHYLLAGMAKAKAIFNAF